MGNLKAGEGHPFDINLLEAFKPFPDFLFGGKVKRSLLAHYFIHLVPQEIFNPGADEGIHSLFIYLPDQIAGNPYQIFILLLCLE
ncbi:hypothetical protein ES703_115508 [subsurface metagenome]